MNRKTVWLLSSLLVLFVSRSAMADASSEKGAKKPPADIPVKVGKAADGEKRPASSYLKVWYEHRGTWDIVHVTNLGTTAAQWTGRIYEDGADCVCMTPRMCIVGPASTNPNGGDTRAYVGLHTCSPIIVIPPPQGADQGTTK